MKLSQASFSGRAPILRLLGKHNYCRLSQTVSESDIAHLLPQALSNLERQSNKAQMPRRSLYLLSLFIMHIIWFRWLRISVSVSAFRDRNVSVSARTARDISKARACRYASSWKTRSDWPQSSRRRLILAEYHAVRAGLKHRTLFRSLLQLMFKTLCATWRQTRTARVSRANGA